MNLLAATASIEVKNEVYNVAVGDRTSLNTLYDALKSSLYGEGEEGGAAMLPTYRDFREGDVLHSQADISKAKRLLGYEPQYKIYEGIKVAMQWYKKNI